MTNLVIANFATGFETDRPAFIINNDAFPTINNAYVWRGRVKKKRGVTLLGRLQRVITVNNALTAGAINLITAFSLEANSLIVPGGIALTGSVDGTVYTDPNKDGTLTATGGTGTGGTINYATGALTITSGANETMSGVFQYNPSLPVMGIEDFNSGFTSGTPGNTSKVTTVFFDTKYSYQFTGSTGPFFDVNFYNATGIHFLWSGADYQQFWTANFQGAMFTTNNTPGMNFLNSLTVTVGNPTTITTAADTVVTGDIVFLNEFAGADAGLLNGQTAIATRTGPGSFTVPINTTGKTINNMPGIIQLLTNTNTAAGKDGIKYYLGPPGGTAPNVTQGWVNFAPPLSNVAAPNYLVGAKIIIPFKNRLLFFGTWTQTSTGNPIYNPNQLVACQDGTVFYANNGLPPNQTADAASFYQNVTGKGLRLNAPISQEIICVSPNNDVLIVIFEKQPLILYFTGDDAAPFLYQSASTEFGAESTFSAIALDNGVLSIGPYGYVITNQHGSSRIDLAIPDIVFNISQTDTVGATAGQNNGIKRVTAIRDFRNEFVYFTFPANANIGDNNDQLVWNFPNTTLAFNYRDNVWSTFTENYTTYGNFRYTSGYTWADLGKKFGTWGGWKNPWNFGQTQSFYPQIACGNQQGFIMLKQESTFEADSQYISAITITGSGSGTMVQITSPNHNLNDGDYIIIHNAIGPANINGIIYQIQVNQGDANNFNLYIPSGSLEPTGTYLGNGTYSRLTNINILTKQFPLFWEQGRQIRIGTQRYLLTNTAAGKITVSLYCNQDDAMAANDPQFSPFLPFTNVLLTSPEPTTLNNIQFSQDEIWHRINSSVMGDTVQLGFTLSDAQMRDVNSNSEEIELFAIAITAYPGPPLAI